MEHTSRAGAPSARASHWNAWHCWLPTGPAAADGGDRRAAAHSRGCGHRAAVGRRDCGLHLRGRRAGAEQQAGQQQTGAGKRGSGGGRESGLLSASPPHPLALSPCHLALAPFPSPTVYCRSLCCAFQPTAACPRSACAAGSCTACWARCGGAPASAILFAHSRSLALICPACCPPSLTPASPAVTAGPCSPGCAALGAAPGWLGSGQPLPTWPPCTLLGPHQLPQVSRVSTYQPRLARLELRSFVCMCLIGPVCLACAGTGSCYAATARVCWLMAPSVYDQLQERDRRRAGQQRGSLATIQVRLRHSGKPPVVVLHNQPLGYCCRCCNREVQGLLPDTLGAPLPPPTLLVAARARCGSCRLWPAAPSM